MSSVNVSYWKYFLIIINVHKPEVISVLYDPNVFIHTMGAETFESRQLSYPIFYYRWRRVSWGPLGGKQGPGEGIQLKTSQVYLYPPE